METFIDKNIELINKLCVMGLVSCAVYEQNDTYKKYLEFKKVSKSSNEAILKTADFFDTYEMKIRRVVNRFENKRVY